MPEVSFHTMRHCGKTWLAEEGIAAEVRARIGGWKVRGMGSMDDYTHLNIEPFRPAAEILATKCNAAEGLRAAELTAGKMLEAATAFAKELLQEGPSTISAQPSGVKKHSPWTTA